MTDFITRRASLKRMAAVAAASAVPYFIRPERSIASERDTYEQPTEHDAVAMTEIAKQFMASYHVPGLSVAIARHGKFVYQQGFGVADEANNEKVTSSHLFRISLPSPLIEGSPCRHDWSNGWRATLNLFHGSFTDCRLNSGKRLWKIQ